MMDLHNARNMRNPYMDLANAIILQAVEDYRKDMQRINKSKRKTEVEDAKIDALKLEKFFKSEWFDILSPVDGDYLLSLLRREAKKKYNIGGVA